VNSRETLLWPEERWKALQGQRLVAHLRRAAKSPLYRGRSFEQAAQLLEAAPHDVGHVLRELPFTSKNQLSAAGKEAFGISAGKIAEWVCTSGTLGKPLDVPLSRGDLERLAENEAAALSLAGVGAGDLFILAVGMERMFVAGLAYWLGAQKLGAACVRAGPQLAVMPSLLKDLLGRFRKQKDGEYKTFVIAVPSFLAAIDTRELVGAIDGVIAIGEATRDGTKTEWPQNPLAERVQVLLGCPVLSTYASTETCTTFAESAVCVGGHLNPWLGVLEVVDEAGRSVAADSVGEVVVTPLGVEGMPLVRFRTGDMAAMSVTPCGCGRSTPRLGPIVGRKQQLLKLRGTSVYPDAILGALRTVEGLVDCLIVAEQEPMLGDRLTLHLQLHAGTDRTQVTAILRGLLRVVPEVQYVTANELAALRAATSSAARKSMRFIDRRPSSPGGPT
jgi:phenylacetate-CoA ligase